MERAPKLISAIALVILIALGLITYAYLQSREYLRGPVVTVTEPLNGSMSTSSRVLLFGLAHNASFITLNGRKIFTDERDHFRELVLLQEGYNIVTVRAEDRFGHTVEKKLELVYKPVATSTFQAQSGA